METLTLAGVAFAVITVVVVSIYLVMRGPVPFGESFRRLGNLQGRSLKQIIDFVGLPTSYSSMPGGKLLVQWMATGFHISLLFEYRGPLGGSIDIDANRQHYVCLGISHQFGS